MSVKRDIAVALRRACWHDPPCSNFERHQGATENIPLNADWSEGYTKGFKDGQWYEASQRGILLRGWECLRCRRFNGEEKERRYTCSSCGQAKVSEDPPNP